MSFASYFKEAYGRVLWIALEGLRQVLQPYREHPGVSFICYFYIHGFERLMFFAAVLGNKKAGLFWSSAGWFPEIDFYEPLATQPNAIQRRVELTVLMA